MLTIALALKRFGQDNNIVMQVFERWSRCSGRTLKIEKRNIVMGTGEVGRYREALARCAEPNERQLTTQAVYVGVNIGPDASAHRWNAVRRNIKSRVSDISGEPSLTGRTIALNVHTSSLLMYMAQFASLSADIVCPCRPSHH